MNSNSLICRVCLLSDSKAYALSQRTEIKAEFTLLDMYNASTHLEALEDDDLPQFICQTCSNDLQIAFDFINKAISSDKFLKTQINQVKIEEVEYLESEQDHNGEAEGRFVSEQSASSSNEQEEDIQNEEIFQRLETFKIEIDNSKNTEHNQGFDKEFEEYVVEEKSSDSTECKGYPKNSHLQGHSAMDGTAADPKKINCLISDMHKPFLQKTNQTVECEHCGKHLKLVSLKHHLKRCQKGEKLHLCSSCPKSFAVRSDLKNHMRIHDKERERKFMCTECGKGFFEKQTLQVHLTRHMGIKEFNCKLCPKTFTTKKSLEAHEFTHNRESGKFVCKHCEKRFTAKADLTVHERFHTGDYPYQCEFCGKCYAVKSHYNYHIAKHQGVTYKCDQCDKEFINRGSLIAHRFKHRDHMPHECSICKKGFTSPFKLNRHKNCHRPKEDDCTGNTA